VTVAFDADVLIYSASPEHPIGRQVRPVLQDPSLAGSLTGSVLLVPELLIKPMRRKASEEVEALLAVLRRLRLVPVDETVASLAVGLGATWGLSVVDATHLACAIHGGAVLFVTNNRKDFRQVSIEGLRVIFPEDL
jgi:predicted nucleic acid-binding protein